LSHSVDLLVAFVGVQLTSTYQSISWWEQVICRYSSWRRSFSRFPSCHGCHDRYDRSMCM